MTGGIDDPGQPLLELFRAHDVEAALCDDWIAFQAKP
jgi:hypothetical protein